MTRTILARGLIASTLTVGALFAGAGTASAAHCVAPAGEEAQPGFSYFGTDHVQEADHAEGVNPGHNNGTPGASSCRDTGSPSDRAPGKNR